MKKNVCLIGIMLWTLSCFWACSDKDDGISPRGMLQIYGRSYDLTSGVIWQNNPNIVTSTVPYVWEDKYVDDGGNEVSDRIEGFETGDERVETGNFLLSLYEEGLVFNEVLETAKGKAACICFHLASPDINRLVPGKYVFDESKKAHTFFGYCSSEYNTQESVRPAAFAAGEVMVEEVGEDYRIVFRCETSVGGEISGEYFGKLDFCRVSQVNSMEYKDISLAGLMEKVKITSWYSDVFIKMVYGSLMETMGITSVDDFAEMMGLEADNGRYFDVENSVEDYDLGYNGISLFSLTTGLGQLVSDASKKPELIDLALLWDKTKSTFCFESPIRVRRWVGHDDKYNFPCHTIYMNAPADFSDADFENLNAETFSFTITEEKVEIPIQDFQPSYVFFQTGKGVQGVIKIISWVPENVQVRVDAFMGGMIGDRIPINSALLMEIKCPAVVANPQIR